MGCIIQHNLLHSSKAEISWDVRSLSQAKFQATIKHEMCQLVLGSARVNYVHSHVTCVQITTRSDALNCFRHDTGLFGLDVHLLDLSETRDR